MMTLCIIAVEEKLKSLAQYWVCFGRLIYSLKSGSGRLFHHDGKDIFRYNLLWVRFSHEQIDSQSYSSIKMCSSIKIYLSIYLLIDLFFPSFSLIKEKVRKILTKPKYINSIKWLSFQSSDNLMFILLYFSLFNAWYLIPGI
jgi:hypothetical protein